MANTTITKTIRSKAFKISYISIADSILPKDYELSLVLIADTLGKKLNKKHKGRDYPTDVLSFPLSDNLGEIFINVRKAQREAKKFGHSGAKHVKYLFIHGCLHLAGYDHGDEMELLEQKYLKKFSQ
ncbi:MAG: rRNA maturation RNase YbeY [Candidatus Pacebacteria bacterium]|nr:rRNA maturation RNase YbeY [Candidatus Paceibacterota bacterium]